MSTKVKRPPNPVIEEADAILLGKALALAARWHGRQARKGTSIPYLSHLLQVAGLVLQHGGNVTTAVAGMLHDAIEDCDDVDEGTISTEFGADVARIVSSCSDTLPGDRADDKAPWILRKHHYLEHLAAAPHDVVLVSACDKRHNLGALVEDLRREGRCYLERFNSTPEDQIWFYSRFASVISGRITPGLESEIRALVREFSAIVRGEHRPA